jgi:polyhydroxyalkanoate synthesis regulator phasin
VPQPRTTSGRTKATSRRPAAKADTSPDSLREQLQRLLNPLEAIVITRDRLQEVLDDAVDRGRMTRDDATDLLSEVVRRGRKQTEDLLSALGTPTDRVLREVDRARRATGVGSSFPIRGYDDLTAAQVSERLRELSPAELRKVRDYERRNANRKSVLAAIEQRLR